MWDLQNVQELMFTVALVSVVVGIVLVLRVQRSKWAITVPIIGLLAAALWIALALIGVMAKENTQSSAVTSLDIDQVYREGNFNRLFGKVVDGPFCNIEGECVIEVRLEEEGDCHSVGDVVTAYCRQRQALWIGEPVYLFSGDGRVCDPPRARHMLECSPSTVFIGGGLG